MARIHKPRKFAHPDFKLALIVAAIRLGKPYETRFRIGTCDSCSRHGGGTSATISQAFGTGWSAHICAACRDKITRLHNLTPDIHPEGHQYPGVSTTSPTLPTRYRARAHA